LFFFTYLWKAAFPLRAVYVNPIPSFVTNSFDFFEAGLTAERVGHSFPATASRQLQGLLLQF